MIFSEKKNMIIIYYDSIQLHVINQCMLFKLDYDIMKTINRINMCYP